jgi:hypothetical protein
MTSAFVQFATLDAIAQVRLSTRGIAHLRRDGGTVISITGTGVASTSSVMVGGNACTNVRVISPS